MIIDKSIQQYLNDNHLNEVLNIIINKINEYFDYAYLHLEYIDNQLILLIITDYSPEQASEKLAIFDEHWWIDNQYIANGKICIDIQSK